MTLPALDLSGLEVFNPVRLPGFSWAAARPLRLTRLGVMQANVNPKAVGSVLAYPDTTVSAFKALGIPASIQKQVRLSCVSRSSHHPGLD